MPRSPRWLAAALATATAVASFVVGVAVAPPASASIVIDGPDVSSYQHPYGAKINWSKVASAHKEFAIVKATEGTYYLNPYFRGDYWHVHEAGMVRGSYHFARPAYPLVSTATAQAKFYVAQLGASVSTAKTLAPALDLEVTGGLSRGALVTWAQTFLLTVRQLTGRTPMIYTYPSFWTSALGDVVALKRYPLWMASYGSPADPSATLWQYTSGASVTGIRGRVDMSKLTAPAASWSTFSDGRIATPWPVAAPSSPHGVWAEPAAGSATVHWMPGDTGSTAITRYRITALPSGTSVIVGGARTKAVVTGLRNGYATTFTVTAVNGIGPSPASVQSQSVTPRIPTAFAVRAASSLLYSRGTWLHAVLKRPDTGTVLPGRSVTLQVRRHGTTTWTSMSTLTTDATGAVARWLRPSTSIDYRLRYAGPFGWRTAISQHTIIVRSGIGARLSRTRVRVRHGVAIVGHIAPFAGGIRVLRQQYVGWWKTVATTVTSETGTYRFHFAPSSTGRHVYRTVVAAYGGRARGYSRTLVLSVVR